MKTGCNASHFLLVEKKSFFFNSEKKSFFFNTKRWSVYGIFANLILTPLWLGRPNGGHHNEGHEKDAGECVQMTGRRARPLFDKRIVRHLPTDSPIKILWVKITHHTTPCFHIMLKLTNQIMCVLSSQYRRALVRWVRSWFWDVWDWQSVKKSPRGVQLTRRYGWQRWWQRYG